MKQKMTDLQKKYIIQMMEELIKWHLETMDNIKEQYLSVRPLTVEINLIHDLEVYIRNIDIDPDEWEDLYIIAGERARKEYFDTVRKIDGK